MAPQMAQVGAAVEYAARAAGWQTVCGARSCMVSFLCVLQVEIRGTAGLLSVAVGRLCLSWTLPKSGNNGNCAVLVARSSFPVAAPFRFRVCFLFLPVESLQQVDCRAGIAAVRNTSTISARAQRRPRSIVFITTRTASGDFLPTPVSFRCSSVRFCKSKSLVMLRIMLRQILSVRSVQPISSARSRQLAPQTAAYSSSACVQRT